MKSKRISAVVVMMLLGGLCLYVSAQNAPPALQQVADNQANGPGDARGKGRLMVLEVPSPEAFKAGERSGWRLKIPGGRPLATPAVVDGTLFVGGGFGSYEFYALDAATGKRRWTFKCGDDGPTAAVAAEGCVAYNTESCTIYIHDLKTGKVLWHGWLGDPLMSQPAIGSGKVLMAYPAGGGHRLAAFTLRKGEKVWEKPIAAEIITAPVIAGDDVIAATVDGTLYRFDLATGTLRWSKKLNVTSALRVLGGRILISQRSSKTIEIEGEKGRKTSSEVTLEGVNVVSLAKGDLAHAEPLSPVKASFLLSLGAQGGLFSDNANNAFAGQQAYRRVFAASRIDLRSIGGERSEQARQLAEKITDLHERKASKDPSAAKKDAEEALKLAADLDKLAAGEAANDAERQANRRIKEMATDVRETAAKTREAAEAAEQAQQTIKATKYEVERDQVHSAGVGFATAPQAAKVQLAAGNIGQGNVKAIWAYQGSRPCLFEGTSIMVHGPTMRAVEVATGKVVWEHRFDFKDEATRPVTPPALAGGKLYVGTVDGRIICLDARKGTTLWQASVGGNILFEPSVVAGNVYAATGDGTVICLGTGDQTADGWAMWGGTARHNGQEK